MIVEVLVQVELVILEEMINFFQMSTIPFMVLESIILNVMI